VIKKYFNKSNEMVVFFCFRSVNMFLGCGRGMVPMIVNALLMCQDWARQRVPDGIMFFLHLNILAVQCCGILIDLNTKSATEASRKTPIKRLDY